MLLVYEMAVILLAPVLSLWAGGGRVGLGWHRVCTERLLDLKCPEMREGRVVVKVKFPLFNVVEQLHGAETKLTLQKRHCKSKHHAWQRT